ncbi:MAG: hypothetical protein ABI333_15490 [bacterium]
MSVVIGSLALTVGCGSRSVGDPGNQNNQTDPNVPTFQQSANDAVDLLFVVDNSLWSAELIANLQQNAHGLIDSLKALPGGAPNLHLGVVSTDLGTGIFNITYCEDPEDHAGKLVRGSCSGAQLNGVNWIVDVEPEGCEVQKTPGGLCLSHSCTPSQCDHEPTTTYLVDAETGCPRCRNFGTTLPELFNCLVDLPVPGCGAVRVFELVSALNHEEDLHAWAYSSACSADYTPSLFGLGDRITLPLEYQCLPAPLAGCADPGVEYGSPHAAQTCAVNLQCLADCLVVDVRDRGTPQEIRAAVPPCLEVIPSGEHVVGNRDRTLAYSAGHPDSRDAALPVAACWHIGYQPQCSDSNYGELVIARRVDPPPNTVAEVTCAYLPPDENDCGDDLDNDQDCLVDLDDPCCANPTNCVGP